MQLNTTESIKYKEVKNTNIADKINDHKRLNTSYGVEMTQGETVDRKLGCRMAKEDFSNIHRADSIGVLRCDNMKGEI